MAISRILLSHLRYSRHLSSSLSAVSLASHSHLLNVSDPLSSPHHHSPAPRVCLLAPFYFSLSRSFSVRSDEGSELRRLVPGDESAPESVTGLEGAQLGFSGVSEEVSKASAEASGFLTLPVISLLDWYHDLTGLPWWVVIASSTMAVRLALVPILILQLKKSKRISEFLPKLPPLKPPPQSGRSYIDQFMLFRKERKAIGCPSYLWIPAYFSIQVSCFLLWITSIRRMSLEHHPGFECGGALWFQNLTEIPNGPFGPIFPFLVAGLQYVNTQISFETSSVRKLDQFGTLAKNYKLFLNFMTLVLYFLAYQIPQGSLVYWVTNLSFNIAQQSFIKHPVVRAKLGLPEKGTVQEIRNSEKNIVQELGNSETINADEIKSPDSPPKGRMISVQDLTPQELVALSVLYLSKEQKERSIPLLRLALEKDPEYANAMIILGQTLLKKNQLPEATEYLERATSKLLAACPMEVEDVDLLIVASQWAGVANIRRGKMSEGLVHLERVANMKEPDDLKSKAHYFDALVLLSSALYNEGRKDEASKYLRLVVAYDPAYKELSEQCKQDDGSFCK